MNLTDSCLKELENPSLTHNERVLLRCRLASQFIHAGQYETAREALGELWQGVGRRPEVERLKPMTVANVLLQCGVLSGWLGRIQHLSGAQEKAKDLIFEALRMSKAERHQDTGNLAQVNETRARVFVAERYYTEANHIISGVIQTFEQGSEYAMLTDALTIQGVARARLGLHESSLQILRYAMSMAQNSGAYSNAGLASLTLIEEHGEERLSVTELFDGYNRADDLLKDTQDAEEVARLRACSRLVMRRLLGMRTSDNRFTLPRAMHDCEARLIREALEATEGIVSHAAKRLGVPHQMLVHALNTRHQDLLSFRTPAQRRRKSLIRPKSIANKRKTKN